MIEIILKNDQVRMVPSAEWACVYIIEIILKNVKGDGTQCETWR